MPSPQVQDRDVSFIGRTGPTTNIAELGNNSQEGHSQIIVSLNPSGQLGLYEATTNYLGVIQTSDTVTLDRFWDLGVGCVMAPPEVKDDGSYTLYSVTATASSTNKYVYPYIAYGVASYGFGGSLQYDQTLGDPVLFSGLLGSGFADRYGSGVNYSEVVAIKPTSYVLVAGGNIREPFDKHPLVFMVALRTRRYESGETRETLNTYFSCRISVQRLVGPAPMYYDRRIS